MINNRLERFITAWNNHTIAGAEKPKKLYSPVLQNPSFVPQKKLTDVLEHFGVEGNSLNTEDEETVVVPNEIDPLTNEEKQVRQQLLSNFTTNYIDQYLLLREITNTIISLRQ